MARAVACLVDDAVAVDSETEDELNTPLSSEDEYVPSWAFPSKLQVDQLQAADHGQGCDDRPPQIRTTPGIRKKRVLGKSVITKTCMRFFEHDEEFIIKDADEAERSAERSPRPSAYRVDRGVLRIRTRGLAYRLSTSLEDRSGEEPAPWGSIVQGIPVDEDWLDVGGRFLPFRLHGVFVLVPLRKKVADPKMAQAEALHTAADEGAARHVVCDSIYVTVRRPCGKVLLPAFRMCPTDRLAGLRHAAEVAVGCGVGLQCRLAYGNELLKERHTVEEAGLRSGAEVLVVVEKDRNASIVDDIIPVDSDSEQELNTPEISDIDS